VGADPLLVGAVVSLSAAAGRTMSPVAAVVLMCAALTETSPGDLVRRVALPLAAGVLALLLAALVLA
jgi:DcuC family C4-dicarboxylate transporter